MKHHSSLSMWIIVLLLTSCTQLQPTTSTLRLQQITPNPNKSLDFREILNFAGSPKKAKWLGDTQFNPDQFKFYLSVFTDEKQAQKYFMNDDIDQRFKVFAGEILLAIEWGAYSSGRIKVNVIDAKTVSNNHVDVIVVGGRTPPNEEAIASEASGFSFVAIQRRNLDFSVPITFNLVNNGNVVATEVLKP